MIAYRFPLFTLLITFCSNLSAQTIDSKLSDEINRVNHQSFELTDSDPIQAKKLNQYAFSLLRNGHIDTIVRSEIYSVAGTIESQKGNYDKAISYFLKSLDIRKSTNNISKIADMTLNVANTFYYAKNYEKSIIYYRECLSYQKEIKNNKLNYLSIYNGLSQVYESLPNRDSTIYYYNKGLELVKRLPNHNDPSVSDLYINLGSSHETSEQYDQAMFYYNKALSIQQAMGNRFDMSCTYHHMGIVSDYKKNYDQAKSYYNIAEQIALEQSDTISLRDISESWMLLYSHTGNLDSVNYYFDRVKQLNEKINEIETRKNTLELETKYQTEIKDEKLKLSELERLNEKQKADYILLGFTLSSIIILTFFYFLIRTYRQKQRIALMQVDLKSREIDELLNQQETTVYAAMLEGQDQERLRIARDLHDRLGSTLAAVKLGLQSDPQSMNAQNQQLVDVAITEVRSIAHNLSGMNIERYGLNVALYELKIRIERAGKINVELYLDETPLGIELSIELYRVVQELVSNTLKYAGANTITVQTSHQQDNFNLMYEDDGSGFDPGTVSQGMGIRNIRHRIEKLNGRLDIDAQPGRGSITIINVPLHTAL